MVKFYLLFTCGKKKLEIPEQFALLRRVFRESLPFGHSFTQQHFGSLKTQTCKNGFYIYSSVIDFFKNS